MIVLYCYDLHQKDSTSLFYTYFFAKQFQIKIILFYFTFFKYYVTSEF